MTTGSTLTEVQVPPKEPTFSSSRLLSKITRSPTSSRRHRPVPSGGSGSDANSIADLTSRPSTQGASHSRLNAPQRPAFQRQISAPNTSVLLKEEIVGPRHFSDATGEAAQQAKAMLNKHQQSKPLPLPTSISPPTAGTTQNTMFAAPLVSEYYADHRPATGTQPAVNYMYQQLHELSNKRIATLNYMRKAHEGRSFWFNTAHFSRTDISRMPSYTPNRLSRRATNYLLLGLSIPTVLDVHQPTHQSSAQNSSALALEFLKSLNTLLAEFETYQERHPTDSSHVGSLSRARLPSMFKRTGTMSRPRKSSAAPSTEIGAQISPPAVPDTPHVHSHHAAHPSIDTTTTAITTNSSASTLINTSLIGMPSHQHNFSNTATFPPPGPPEAPNSSLLSNEAPYTHLLTPPLPFAPDFYTVFATLCDVLIDTYQRLLQMVNSPSTCTAMVSEMFSRADARIRKVMIGGVIKDFETASRESARRELAGIQKVVLGGLMG